MQRSTILVVIAALVMACAAEYGSIVLFPFGRLRIEGHEHDNGAITGCDDCSTKAKQIHYNPVRIDGMDYEAFAVHSNGYVTLYPNKNSKVIPYRYADLENLKVPSYNPPIIAALWSDIDLYCEAYHSEENSVYFEETTDQASLFLAASIVAQRTGDDEFRPQSMLVFTWDTVQPYDCPKDIRTNTFQLVVAMERIPSREDTPSPVLTRTYVIMLYRTLGWMESDTGDLPVIGVGGMRSSEAVPVTTVNDTLINGGTSGILVFRVDGEEDDICLFYPSYTAQAEGKGMKPGDVLMEKNPKKKGKAALIQDLIQENLEKYKKRGH